MIFRKSTFQDFPHFNALEIKFDLTEKYVKVDLGSTFGSSNMKFEFNWPNVFLSEA